MSQDEPTAPDDSEKGDANGAEPIPEEEISAPEPSVSEGTGEAESFEADVAPDSEAQAAEAQAAEAPEASHVAAERPPKEITRWEVYFPSSRTQGRSAVYVASFPPIIYFWPSMLTFWMCGVVQWFGWIDPGMLGWIAVCVFAFNVLVTVQDFDQKQFLIFVLILTVAALSVWIIEMKEYTFLRRFVRWLLDMDVQLSTSAYIIFGCVFGILMAWGLLRPMFDYWRLEHNEFVHYIQPFGRDMSIPRAGSTVTKKIPDILEFILTFGGGSLVIKREGRTWAVIPHIPMLGRRMKVIEKMLSETRVTTVDD